MIEEADAAMRAGKRLFDVVESGDIDALREVFSEGALVWHNTDDKAIDVEQTITNLKALRQAAEWLRYDDIRREPTPSGFVQQHVLLVKMKDGQEIRDMCCCVCRVESGRVTRMDAYHDSAALPIFGTRAAGKDA